MRRLGTNGNHRRETSCIAVDSMWRAKVGEWKREIEKKVYEVLPAFDHLGQLGKRLVDIHARTWEQRSEGRENPLSAVFREQKRKGETEQIPGVIGII